MKDRDNQFLFESYMHSLEEGRKKQFKERERKTVIDPTTGEERKESYYEMMMRLKGKAGPRSKALRQRKEKKSDKVRLQNRENIKAIDWKTACLGWVRKRDKTLTNNADEGENL